jgi:hypothetical protein
LIQDFKNIIEDVLDEYIRYHNSTKKTSTRYIPNYIIDLDNDDLICLNDEGLVNQINSELGKV